MNAEQARPWVRALRPGAAARLLCFPHAGGPTADFRSWSEGLSPDIDLCPVVLPGRETRFSEPAIDDLGKLVESMLPTLLPVLREAPFALYGHSMGAWVAFALVRALRRLGRVAPVHLFVAARRAPHRPARLPPLSALPDAQLVDGIQARFGGIPDAIRNNADLMRLFLPTLRADFTLLDRYAYVDEPPLDVPITAFLGEDDKVEVEADVKAWREHTSGAFRFVHFGAGHFFVKDQPDPVFDAVNAALRR